jgi:hypothetical protein
VAIRFRRSLKLAPGLRLNFSGSGVSFSAGPRGASVSFGSRGTFLNTGIPGTGLYSRSRLDGAPAHPANRPGKVNVGATIKVEDDGTVVFLDENEQPLSDYLVNLAKRQYGSQIREMLEKACTRINEETDAIARIHRHTPSPNETPQYQAKAFEEEQPTQPALKAVGMLDRLLAKREKIEQQNVDAVQRYEEALAHWKASKLSFEAGEARKAAAFDHSLRNDDAFMQQVLESNLTDIVWPRETLVSFELNDQARSILIDADLPEIEDLQRKTASLPERGYKLSLKEIKGKALQALYTQHVHGVGFRIVGEVFATLPMAQLVTLSAYTQRVDPGTGHSTDTYVYSVRIPRAHWSETNFANLAEIDVVAAFERFECRRKLSKNGVLEAIEPF